jgi:imidazolonepropionase-like amidohydrolase
MALLLLLLSPLAIAARAQVPDSGGALAIRAGRLVDPATGLVLRDQVILVRGGKITAVGAALAVPDGTPEVDLSRETVLPGLFDAHTHLCMTVRMRRDAGSYYYTTLNDDEAARAVDGVINARDMLHAGFTTVRDVGNEGNYACSAVRRAVEQGRIPGPTFLNAGRIIAPYGGQFQLQPHKREPLGEPEYYFADSRDELRKAVRENAHYGARVIKLVVDDQPYIYSIDDIRFVIQEARRMNLRVAAHVWTRQGAHNAAAAGVSSLEHLNGVSDEDLAIARKNDVVAVFTPFPDWVLRAFRDGGSHRRISAGAGPSARGNARRRHDRVRIRCHPRVARLRSWQPGDGMGEQLRGGRNVAEGDPAGDDDECSATARRRARARRHQGGARGRHHRRAGRSHQRHRGSQAGELRYEERPSRATPDGLSAAADPSAGRWATGGGMRQPRSQQ